MAYINSGTGAWVDVSDSSFKKEVNDLSPILNKVKKLRPISFLYKNQGKKAPKNIGFIAQEVKELFPEVVSTGEDGKLGIAYAHFGPIAIKGIQEQQTLIEKQAGQIKRMQGKISSLELKMRNLLAEFAKLKKG